MIIRQKAWDSAMFNLDSMREHLLYQIDMIHSGQAEGDYEELRTRVEEVEDLLGMLKSGRLPNYATWKRIQQIVKERQMMRYTTCLASGMDEATAAGAFQD